jgi:NAD(P)-dependent dehydrogenase (short-subunit alcohol dehydrogenase family)
MGSDLSEHVALVTGGVRGIGRAIGEALMDAGARVAAGYSRNGPAADAFVEDFSDRGATIHQGTIEDHADCERVVAEVIDHHGRLDILVNNAGITMDRTVRKMTPEEWDHVLRVNLNGAFYMSRAALPDMVDRGYGRIINISSVVGERGNVGQANYAASKAGQFGLTMSLALEVANKGITVNCVAPGFIETDMTGVVPEEIMQRVIEGIPMRRLGRPEEVARVVQFLAEPASSYITGQVYSINGGLNM